MYQMSVYKAAIFVFYEIICIYFKCHLDSLFSAFPLTPKQLKIHGCILNTVQPVALMPKHQATNR